MYFFQGKGFESSITLVLLSSDAGYAGPDFHSKTVWRPLWVCELLTEIWVWLEDVSIFSLAFLQLMVLAQAFQTILGGGLELCVEGMVPESFVFLSLDKEFFFSSGFQRLNVGLLFHLWMRVLFIAP